MISEVNGVAVEREIMEVDVLIVGGGAAGLSCAYHIQGLIEKHNQAIVSGSKAGASISEPMIVVLEKGMEVGAHSMSGAVMDPRGLSELIPDFREQGCPIAAEVNHDEFHYFTKSLNVRLPVPPPLKNEGKLLVSLADLNRWLASKAEERGVNIFPGFAAVEALYDGDRVIGVRTGDRGVDRHGKPKANFEAGMILKSKITIFAEGTRGSLFKQVARKFNLWAGKNPEVLKKG